MGNSFDIIQAYQDEGCLLDGHFIGTSGVHLRRYFFKDGLSDATLDCASDQLIWEFQDSGLATGHDTLTIVPLANGALRLGEKVSQRLSEILSDKQIRHLPTSKDINGVIRLHNDLQGSEQHAAILIEDNITTGKSCREVQEMLVSSGHDVIATLSLINKSSPTLSGEEMGLRNLIALATYQLTSYDFKNVPEDLKSTPISTKCGHGKKIMSSQDRRNKYLAAGFQFESC